MPCISTLVAAALLAQTGGPEPPALGGGDFSPADQVVILLDASGSMRETLPSSSISKMKAAKDALVTVLRQIPLGTHVGLLVFGGQVGDHPWLYPLGPRNDAALLAAINAPQPDGGTPLGEFIKKAADRLLEARAARFGYGTYRLLVVTDGEAQDADAVDRYVPDVLARGIIMDVIGVGMEQDHTLATRVHSYRRADDPASLTKALQEVFAEVGDPRVDERAEDAFALIAPIPNQTALAMLQALSRPANAPIGSPAEPPASSDVPGGGPTSPPTPPEGGGSTSESGGLGGLLGAACCATAALSLVAGWVLVRVMTRRARR